MDELRIYLSEELEWTDRAECRDIEPSDVFFEVTNPAYVRMAKSICSMCTVKKACIEFALRTDQKDGIWGGLTPKERRRLR